jgi:protein-tyrosine phosphatase
MIATPHHGNGRYDNPAQSVRAAVAALNHELEKQGIALTILPGQEIRFNGSLFDEWDRRIVMSLNDTRYLLLELPSHCIPDNFDEILHELTILGLVPIIAHPERNEEIVRQPDRLRSLVVQGALSQVTSHSVTGLFGRKIQKTALELCRMNLVHFIASDTHKSSVRPNQLQSAYSFISSRLGAPYTRYYQQNAVRLVNNEPIDTAERAAASRGRKWYAFWKGSTNKS